MFIKAEEGAGSLSVMDAYFFQGWDHYSPPCDCQPHEEPKTFCGKLDFWISDCFTPVLTIHNFDALKTKDMTNSHFRIDRGWISIGYSFAGHYDDGSTARILHNGAMVHTESLANTIYKAIGDDFEATLGSFHGSAYHFQGFMHHF
jgi:hypothetical protein